MKVFHNTRRAIERYNLIVENECREYLTIGTCLSENTENWNLRDMISELDYLLHIYCKEGSSLYNYKFGDEYERKHWKSQVGKIKRFIAYYEEYIEDMYTVTSHCSDYDNELEIEDKRQDILRRQKTRLNNGRFLTRGFINANLVIGTNYYFINSFALHAYKDEITFNTIDNRTITGKISEIAFLDDCKQK